MRRQQTTKHLNSNSNNSSLGSHKYKPATTSHKKPAPTPSTNNLTSQQKQQINSNIAYTIFPISNLNSKVNSHRKCTNLYGYNFDTLAYEKYAMGRQPQTEIDRNYIKNYYLQNVPAKIQFQNQIVKQLEEQVYPYNAYVLFCGLQMPLYRIQHKEPLNNIMRFNTSADSIYNLPKGEQDKTLTHMRKLREFRQCRICPKGQVRCNNYVQERWIKKIIMTLQDLGERMFGLGLADKQNQSSQSNKRQQEGAERVFLREKSHVNLEFLKECQAKICDPAQAHAIFQDLRCQMLRKKNLFEQQRLINAANKNSSLNASSFTSASEGNNSLYVSGNQSMLSVVSSQNSRNNAQRTKQQLISELCDFQALKSKWKTQDVDRIKDIILKYLTNTIIMKCQGQMGKKGILKQKQRQKQRKRAKSLGSGINVKNHINNNNKTFNHIKKHQRRTKSESRNRKKLNQTSIDPSLALNHHANKLITKQEQIAKNKLAKGSFYDSIGCKYERARNYSNVFMNKNSSDNEANMEMTMKLDLNRFKQNDNIKCKDSQSSRTARPYRYHHNDQPLNQLDKNEYDQHFKIVSSKKTTATHYGNCKSARTSVLR